ncbi:MAG: T9SS type A sorting domain-containing protein [Bacteroidales bacterium]|nr:T9SS type A sorting domain-containing protein [Bacteroidales bacterium]
MPGNNVREIAIDGNGTKWIGTSQWASGSGLAAYNKNGIPWVHENKKREHLVSVYPNPVDDHVIIELHSKLNASFIEIIDIRGILAKYFKVISNKNTICIRDLPNGLYIVRLHTDNGTLSEKFIKK